MDEIVTAGDELRARARELADNKEWWVKGEPRREGQMCAAFNFMGTRITRKYEAFTPETMRQLERWLPRYIREAFPNIVNGMRGGGNRLPHYMEVTFFNDTIARDVDDVIVMLEKGAAEIG